VTKVKTLRYCAECGKLLRPKNQKYCSDNCFRKAKAKAKNKRTVICKTCGKEFIQTGKKDRTYCSIKCYKEDNQKGSANTRPVIGYEELNRPFTNDTPYLVNLWHKKHGNSFEEIAMILNRSIDNVKQAYNMYAQEGLHETRVN
jgi:predicted transcriptional regulator